MGLADMGDTRPSLSNFGNRKIINIFPGISFSINIFFINPHFFFCNTIFVRNGVGRRSGSLPLIWSVRFFFKAEAANQFSVILSECLNLKPKPAVYSNTFLKILNQYMQTRHNPRKSLSHWLCKRAVGKTLMLMSGCDAAYSQISQETFT
jgi:hypothetical protein